MTNDVHSIDELKLASYLAANIEGFSGPLTAEKFSDGQSNPTYLLTAASGQYVLRRKPPGVLLPSAHAVDREYRVLTALEHTDVPVAQAYHLCEDDSIIGSMFYVMSFEAGNVFWDPSLPEFTQAERGVIYQEIIRVMAAMHSVDLDKVGLADYGKPGNYFERQISRWSKQYRASETDEIPSMDKLIEWLVAHLPSDDSEACLIHGDYRLDNLMLHAKENRIIAVLDWELSTLGNPLADLAYFCMGLRLPKTAHSNGLAGMDRKALGIPSEEDIVAQYCRLRGVEKIEHWHFYLAFSYFRLAAIAQGVYKRSLGGNASNKNAAMLGEMVQVLSSMAMALIEEQ